MTRWQAIREVYPIRAYQLVGILVAITATWAIGIYGVVRYVDDRDELACQRRDELATIVSSAFEVVFDTIEEQTGPSEVLADARDALDVLFVGLVSPDCT